MALARRYRRESIATLIAVSRNERAPASSRAQAAAKLLEYSDGKPAQARPVTAAAVAATPIDQLWETQLAMLSIMTRAQHLELMWILHSEYGAPLPDEVRRVLAENTDAMLAELTRREAATPKTDRLNGPSWGSPSGGLPGRAGVKRKLTRPGAGPALAEPDGVSEGHPELEIDPDLYPPARRNVGLDVVPPQPAPQPSLQLSSQPSGAAAAAAPSSKGSIHPDVLYRSTLPPSLALDSALWRNRTRH